MQTKAIKVRCRLCDRRLRFRIEPPEWFYKKDLLCDRCSHGQVDGPDEIDEEKYASKDAVWDNIIKSAED